MEPMTRQMQSADVRVVSPRWCVASSDVEGELVEAVVCVPTFRRPGHLQKTLRSVLAQRTARRFVVVVVENDASAAEGAAVAAQFFRQEQLEGICIVEPRQGNC